MTCIHCMAGIDPDGNGYGRRVGGLACVGRERTMHTRDRRGFERNSAVNLEKDRGPAVPGVTVKGCTKVGMNLLLFTVHPMKPGATLMSSFLFNTALVLLATNAVIQFCQQAFALYASSSAISEIWGNQVGHACLPRALLHPYFPLHFK